MFLDRLALLDKLIKRTEIMEKENIGIIREIFTLDSIRTMKQLKESCISCNQMALALFF